MIDASPSIGRVFTPLDWAKCLIQESGAFQAWIQGVEILDPTCDDGIFLEAFIALGQDKGQKFLRERANPLHGIEIIETDRSIFLKRIY